MRDLSNQNWVKTERISQLADVKIYAANFAGERIVPRHVHHEYVFGLVVGGAAEIDCGHRGEKYILQPNDLLLTEAREVYSCRSLGVSPWHYLSISVPPEKLVSLLDFEADGKRVNLPHYTRSVVKNNLLRRAFLKLRDSLGNERTALEQESLLLEWVFARQQKLRGTAEPNTRPPDLFGNRRGAPGARVSPRKRARKRQTANARQTRRTQPVSFEPLVFRANRFAAAQISKPNPHRKSR